MNILRNTARYAVLAGFCLLTILGTPKEYLYADTPYQYRNTANKPLSSLKCNEFTFDATRSQLPKSPNISFLWDFGDGITSADPIATHTYQQSGDYTVNLSITDNSGFECSTATTSQTVRVNIPPHASFISEDRACINEEMTFDAGTSYTDAGKNLDYSWNFGDGEIRKGPSQIKKSYAKGGDYRIRLTVDDQSGTFCSDQTAEKIVHINEPPLAEAGDAVILRCVGDNREDMIIHFDASATTDVNSDPLTYIWDFGDGHKEKGIKISHRYEEIGNYDVRLIASDNTGLSCGTSVDFVTVKLNQTPQANAGDDVVTCVGKDVSFDGSQSYIHKKGTALAQWFFGDGTSNK
ncbi:MAG: PKD domain-containing protein, partial [Candidatus Omnitrophica bacterium]|nr:PKD domain-containing protein [Candidatus Omnitrophota bacterium]